MIASYRAYEIDKRSVKKFTFRIETEHNYCNVLFCHISNCYTEPVSFCVDCKTVFFWSETHVVWSEREDWEEITLSSIRFSRREFQDKKTTVL